MNAYSHLKRLLKQQQLSIPELHRRMRAQGINVNIKSLYRLNDDSQPVDRLDMRVAGAICQVCAAPLSEWIVFEESAGTLLMMAAEKQVRLETLMARNNSGSLTDQERAELQILVREAEDITLANARLLVQQRQRLAPTASQTTDRVA